MARSGPKLKHVDMNPILFPSRLGLFLDTRVARICKRSAGPAELYSRGLKAAGGLEAGISWLRLIPVEEGTGFIDTLESNDAALAHPKAQEPFNVREVLARPDLECASEETMTAFIHNNVVRLCRRWQVPILPAETALAACRAENFCFETVGSPHRLRGQKRFRLRYNIDAEGDAWVHAEIREHATASWSIGPRFDAPVNSRWFKQIEKSVIIGDDDSLTFVPWGDVVPATIGDWYKRRVTAHVGV